MYFLTSVSHTAMFHVVLTFHEHIYFVKYNIFWNLTKLKNIYVEYNF